MVRFNRYFGTSVQLIFFSALVGVGDISGDETVALVHWDGGARK